MERVRANFVRGTSTNTPLADSDTTLNSLGLSDLPEITSGQQYSVIVLDANALDGAPEIVYVTDHTSAATSATISRGEEGTVARAHLSGTTWIHGATAEDFYDKKKRLHDYVDGDPAYDYIGISYEGAPTGSAVWKITRVTIQNDGSSVAETAIDVEWDDRLTETYT